MPASKLSVPLLLLILFISSLPSASHAEDEAPRRITWDKTPIAFQLSVGEERRVQFRAPVSIGIPQRLQDVLRVQNVAGTVYFLSQHEFIETRVVVRELDTAQTYLLDVSSVDMASDAAPIVVHLPVSSTPQFDIPSSENAGSPGYVTLTRFAAQQLYSPPRLLRAMPGVRQIPVQRETVLLMPGEAIEATPLIAWRAGDLYITVIKLQNRSRRAQTLDPRTLRGDWLSATFQHARLLPSGSDADTTALYLVSAQAFAASF